MGIVCSHSPESAYIFPTFLVRLKSKYIVCHQTMKIRELKVVKKQMPKRSFIDSTDTGIIECTPSIEEFIYGVNSNQWAIPICIKGGTGLILLRPYCQNLRSSP